MATTKENHHEFIILVNNVSDEILESERSTDKKEALKFYNELKKQYPDKTTTLYKILKTNWRGSEVTYKS